MKTSSNRSGDCRSAFSLLEMIMVIAVISILTVITAPSIVGVSGAQKINSAGGEIVALADMARQNSIAHNTMTALVMVNNSAANPALNNRLFLVLELQTALDGTAAWAPVSKWEVLPAGIVVDPNPNSVPTTFISQTPTLSVPLPALNYTGTSIGTAEYVGQVFLPNGSLMSSGAAADKPPVLRLVAGSLGNSSTVAYAGAQIGGIPANYYDVTILPYTGLLKIARP